MNIPDKAVEAAARARHAREVEGGFFRSEKFQNWDTLGKATQRGYLADVKADLEAAAPHIAAQALRDAAEGLAQKLHEPDCNWGTRADDVGHLLALADSQEAGK